MLGALLALLVAFNELFRIMNIAVIDFSLIGNGDAIRGVAPIKRPRRVAAYRLRGIAGNSRRV